MIASMSTHDAPVTKPDQDPAEADPVRDSRVVAAERMLIDRDRQDRFDRRPDRIGHLRVHRACHDRSASTGRLAWVALDMKIEPTRRPVDAHHLPARLLSFESDEHANWSHQRPLPRVIAADPFRVDAAMARRPGRRRT